MNSITRQETVADAAFMMGTLRSGLHEFYYAPSDLELKVMVGAVAAQGDMIIQGDPGTGKTFFAKTTAALIGGEFGRISGHPGQEVANVIGAEVYNPETGKLEIQKGPIFGNVVLADEINRLKTPRQAALLEAQGERQVTIGNSRLELPNPFVLIATHNPNEEEEGTNNLNRANLDRFAVGLEREHYTAVDLRAVRAKNEASRGHDPEAIISLKDFGTVKEALAFVAVSPEVDDFASQLIAEFHEIPTIKSDVYPESAMRSFRPYRDLLMMAKTMALQADSGSRTQVYVGDIKTVAPFVLAHRIEPTTKALNRGETAHSIVTQAVDEFTNRVA